jgi:hypothetical protein
VVEKIMKMKQYVTIFVCILLLQSEISNAMQFWLHDKSAVRVAACVLFGVAAIGAGYGLWKYLFPHDVHSHDGSEKDYVTIFEGQGSFDPQIVLLKKYDVTKLIVQGRGDLYLHDSYELRKKNSKNEKKGAAGYDWIPTEKKLILKKQEEQDNTSTLSSSKITHIDHCFTISLEHMVGDLYISMDLIHTIELHGEVFVRTVGYDSRDIQDDDVLRKVCNNQLELILYNKSNYSSPGFHDQQTGLRVRFDVIKVTTLDESKADVMEKTYIQCNTKNQSRCKVWDYEKLYVHGKDSSTFSFSTIYHQTSHNINMEDRTTLFTSAYSSFFDSNPKEQCRGALPLLTTNFEGSHISLSKHVKWDGMVYH